MRVLLTLNGTLRMRSFLLGLVFDEKYLWLAGLLRRDFLDGSLEI